ncbi:MAG: transcription-repair coupling factor [Candidatus Omnitrophica bacterium]|nr:transcription-repair coupling factor [Candidatus Omnitrophota bacterium]
MFRAQKVYVGQEINRDRILASLVEFNYKRQDAVADEGEFSCRGGIIDIYPLSFESPVRIEMDNDRVLSIKSFDIVTGGSFWDHQMLIILPVRTARHTRILAYHEEVPLDNLLDLKAGDYVVHVDHGIGRFLGVWKVKTGEKTADHFVIEYDRQEKLYVPVSDMHLIQRYFAFHVRKPKKLTRLGTKEWAALKERIKKGIQRFAWELLTLHAMRLSAGGFAFSKDTAWQEDFRKTFSYVETPDQAKAWEDVKRDMETREPMDRLLCGDVGYGKTEVAMRASFKAVMDNKQVAFLVPTTILAEQHYQNFSGRLKSFPVRVEMLSRFKTRSQQKAILADLAEGKVDMIIGTHRLLAADVSFKDLGLVVIDEEQRFGVKAKEKFKAVRLTCDVLTLTATPIPRTLYMSMMGIKGLSMLDTPPPNRIPIKTYVAEYDEDLIHQAIVKEMNRRGQVFFVHNRIYDIMKVKDRIAGVLPRNTRFDVVHGQMSSAVLERVMLDFLRGKIDVLLSTAIVEAGIDIPNANTLIVNNADNFGLSDLHQLRGRVGRFNKPAYAYFLVSKENAVTPEARKRLMALHDYSQLGSGFKIAMQDLQMRGAGNLLGSQQHGFVMSVGFDLYCRLLKETISTLKSNAYLNPYLKAPNN